MTSLLWASPPSAWLLQASPSWASLPWHRCRGIAAVASLPWVWLLWASPLWQLPPWHHCRGYCHGGHCHRGHLHHGIAALALPLRALLLWPSLPRHRRRGRTHHGHRHLAPSAGGFGRWVPRGRGRSLLCPCWHLALLSPGSGCALPGTAAQPGCPGAHSILFSPPTAPVGCSSRSGMWRAPFQGLFVSPGYF